MPNIIGVNKRAYPTESSHGHGGHSSIRTSILAVLVEGVVGDYACYVGDGGEEFVARHGNKISFEEACCYFPDSQLKREKYCE